MDEKALNPAEEAAVQHPDYKAEIIDILRSNLAPRLLRERVADYHENDIAEALTLMRRDERMRLYSVLDTATLAGVLEYADDVAQLLGEMSVRKRVEVLSQLGPATAGEYLRGMERSERSALIELMPEEARHEILLLSSFDEDEIGSRMSTNYITIHEGMSVRGAMRELVEQAADNDNISTLYVVDAGDMLLGAIDLKDLIIARESTPLESITMTQYPYVYASELIEDCIERLKNYSEDSIPVLDAENRLTGILTSQELTQLVDDEIGEDYARLAGLTAEEDLNEPLKKSIAKRLPWLLVLLGLGILVSGVVGAFETVIASVTIIVSFQSLILDMAGNVGTQSLAITIRVLMDEQLTGRQKLALVGKEMRVGLCNGLILGTLSFFAVGAFLMFMKGYEASVAFSVSLCTGTALLVSMLLSSMSGTVVPLLFKKLKIDPAVASGPLITTINDLIAVVTYYGLAWLLLLQVMHL